MNLCSSIVLLSAEFVLTKDVSEVSSQVGFYDHKQMQLVRRFPYHKYAHPLLKKIRMPLIAGRFNPKRKNFCLLDENQEGVLDEDEDPDTCPVDCVEEFKSDEEFMTILEKAKKRKSLVAVDFYRTACGSCKYIEPAFMKLCKGSRDHNASVIFLKHNVIDEYDDQSEVAERLRIKTVPLFQFYKDGVLLEAFPTRDKEKVFAAINKYT